jgi:hypothetical protein
MGVAAGLIAECLGEIALKKGDSAPFAFSGSVAPGIGAASLMA